MKIRAVIQARMGSTRLRGKTLSPIANITLLKRVYDAILNLGITEDIVIATTHLQEDDPIEAYCLNYLNCSCIRGDVTDVLSRFITASNDLETVDTLMRITADNIFYQKNICSQLVDLHNSNDNAYTAIKGLSHIACELIRVEALRNLENKELTDYDKEHVTPYFINNAHKFKTELVNPLEFGLQTELSSLLTIDTENDRNRIEQLIHFFDSNNTDYSQENLYNWLQNN